MIVTCEKCHRRYRIPQEKLGRRGVTMRCGHCKSKIRLSKDPPEAGDPEWFAIVKGKQVGPLSSNAMLDMVKGGELALHHFMWRKGMAQWKRAKDLAELGPLFRATARPRPPRNKPIAPPVAPLPPVANSQSDDPFHALAASEVSKERPPEEETWMVLEQSGVGKRNPPWKVAIFVTLLVAFPVALLYALSSLRVVPLTVTTVDESGRDVQESVFSSAGVSRLGNLLLGRGPRQRAGAKSSKTPARLLALKPPEASQSSLPAASAPLAAPLQPTGQPPTLQDLYGDRSRTDIGPKVRKGAEEKGKDTTIGELAPKDVAKVVAHAQPAFNFCIEEELKKNPKFRGGKVFISATIGSSGVVKKAEVDRREIDSSSLGACLKAKAKRMVFPAFSGEETEIQIPLILSATM